MSVTADLSAWVGKVHCGDCLEVLRQLPDGCAALVFTDPPYGHNNNDGDLISQREAALGHRKCVPATEFRPIANDGPEANDLFRACLPEYARLLAPGCCCCCCCCGGGGPDPQFARWSMWIDAQPGLDFKQMVVWDKGPIGMGWHYRRSYEIVLVAQKPGAACRWFDETNAVENILRPGEHGIRKVIPQKHQHPTEKPWQLAARFISLHTEPGDLVIDPFCGSGSTLEACVRMGRQFIGIDIDAHWAEHARQRVANTQAQPSLFAAEPDTYAQSNFQPQLLTTADV